MPNDRNRRRLIVTAAAGLLLVFVGTWIVFDITENRPGWLAVEGPETAAVGGRIEFQVKLESREAPGTIVCTLHHADAGKRGWGYLASSGPAQPLLAGRTHTFVFTVPERAGMAYVFALIYLSPTGRWEDGTKAVSTAYIPVVREGGAAATTVLRKQREENEKKERQVIDNEPLRKCLAYYELSHFTLVPAGDRRAGK